MTSELVSVLHLFYVNYQRLCQMNVLPFSILSIFQIIDLIKVHTAFETF